MNPPTIDPGIVSLIQFTFLEHINIAFATTAKYAFNLLYIFATLELVILGLVWALQRDVGWDRLFFKIIKIGLIFFTIQNYTWLLDIILRSFAQLAGIVINDPTISQYVFNPAKIWQYGYNVGVHLLQLATTSNLFGLTLIQFSLGMGILLVFGLLGIQMIVQMVSFYVVSLGALILLPFGALTPSGRMFDKAVQSVFQAGLRLMVVVIIIGIAVTIWSTFQFNDLATTTNFNINQPLGLFFTALLFLSLAFYLPKIIGQSVGDLGNSILEGTSPVVVTSVSAPATVSAEAPAGSVAGMQAATTVPVGGASQGYEGQTGAAAAATMPTTTAGISSGGTIDAGAAGGTLGKASAISKSVSEQTVRKIKEAISQAMKEKK